jgi:hypothetical protein
MKKLSILMLGCILISTSLLTQQVKKKVKKEDPLKNLIVVEKIQPVSENMNKGFQSITARDAEAYLKFLASDSLEGRDTASQGYTVAAEFAAALFEKWGLKPAGDMSRPVFRGFFSRQPGKPTKPKRTYLQHVALKEVVDNHSKVVVEWRKGSGSKKQTFTSNVDYTYSSRDGMSFSAPIVFVGYGIEEKSLKFNEYRGVDVKGKIVMMLSETPRADQAKSPFKQGKLKAKYAPRSRMSRGGFSKAGLAKEKGAIAVLMIENRPHLRGDVARRVLRRRVVNDERPIIPGQRRRMSLNITLPPMPWDTLPTVNISRQMADIILKQYGKSVDELKTEIDKNLKPRTMPLRGSTFSMMSHMKTKLVSSPNVLGYIEGSDPKLKDEVIVIGAHLDHLGKRGEYIYNGADDNGSGSVAVMELAEAFAINKVKPKRSILFALWTGEEKGLLGSIYYVLNPYFPLEKTVANLNLDMVSRTWTKESLKRVSRWFGIKMDKNMLKRIKVENFIAPSFAAQAPQLEKAIRKSNLHVGMSIFLRPSKTGMGGSDHAPFAMKKLPWVFFGAAMTEDYHQPSDSVEKVSFKLIENITRLTYLTAFFVANQ